jgi:hypothetical protein
MTKERLPDMHYSAVQLHFQCSTVDLSDGALGQARILAEKRRTKKYLHFLPDEAEELYCPGTMGALVDNLPMIRVSPSS